MLRTSALLTLLALTTPGSSREAELVALDPSPDYAGGTPEQRRARDLLRAAMEKEGFALESNEWWHFNHRDWKSYPILDVPFAEIPASATAR